MTEDLRRDAMRRGEVQTSRGRDFLANETAGASVHRDFLTDENMLAQTRQPGCLSWPHARATTLRAIFLYIGNYDPLLKYFFLPVGMYRKFHLVVGYNG
jgi:hypothetical protein